MSTTIRVEPKEFQSAYNEIITVLDSNNKHLPKFNHIVEIWIDGVYSSKLKVAPNPQGYGVVNLSKHIESYLTGDLDLTNTDVFKKIPNSFVKYHIVLKEEYVETMIFTSVASDGGFAEFTTTAAHPFIVGDIVTIVITVGGGTYEGEHEITAVNSTTTFTLTEVYTATEIGTAILTTGATSIIDDAEVFSADKFALNNVVEWVDVPSFDPSLYEVDSASPALFLTNLSNYQTVLLDDRINFNFYNPNINEAYVLQVTSTLGKIRIENNFSVTSDDNKFISVGVAPADILNHTGSTITTVSGSSTVIDNTIESYTVQLLDSTFAATSELFTFKVKSQCNPYENYKLIYLNNNGSYSDFNFELGSSKNTSVRKKNYNKNYGTVAFEGESASYGWESYEAGKTTYATDVTDTYTITSDYITELEGEKIADLIISPEVYHLNESGVLRAININTSSVKIKTKIIDKLVNYTVSFNYATKNSTQR